MNRPTLIAVLSLVTACSLPAAEAPNAQDQQVLALVKEIQVQQAQIAQNQAALDAKLAAVTEALRVARIYASRGGH